MNQRNKLAKLGLTPRKTALTVALIIVWFIVLIAQFAPGDSSPPTTRDKQPAGRSVPTQGKAGQRQVHRSAEAPADPAPRRVRKWPEMTLEQVRAYNPFGVPAALAGRASDPDGPGSQDAPANGAADSGEPSAPRKQFLVELRR